MQEPYVSSCFIRDQNLEGVLKCELFEQKNWGLGNLFAQLV